MCNTVGVMLIFTSVFCFFFYWFLVSEVYFTNQRKKHTSAEVVDVMEGKRGVQYKVCFRDADGIERRGFSTRYRKEEDIQKGQSININYMTYQVGTTPIVAVRMEDSKYQKTEHYVELLAAGCVFLFLGIMFLVL